MRERQVQTNLDRVQFDETIKKLKKDFETEKNELSEHFQKERDKWIEKEKTNEFTF